MGTARHCTAWTRHLGFAVICSVRDGVDSSGCGALCLCRDVGADLDLDPAARGLFQDRQQVGRGGLVQVTLVAVLADPCGHVADHECRLDNRNRSLASYLTMPLTQSAGIHLGAHGRLQEANSGEMSVWSSTRTALMN
jgi:hypothetical protein